MKVPNIDAAQVQAANPFSATAPQLRQPDLAPAQAFVDAGKAFGAAGQAIGGYMEEQRKEDELLRRRALAEAEAAKKRAKELQVMDKLADLQRRANDEEQKFLGQKGIDAAKQSGPALDALDAHLDELSQEFQDPEQRAEFIARGKAVLHAPRKSVEIHTRDEHEAGAQASLNALMEGAEKNAGAGKLDGAELGEQIALIDKGIETVYRNPEVAQQKRVEARGRIAAAFIQSRIDAGGDGLEVAQQALEDSKGILPMKVGAVLQNQLEVAQGKRARQQAEAEASASTAKLALDVTGKDGFVVDADFRRAAQAARPKEGPAQEAWDKAMEEESRRQKARLDAELDRQRNLADQDDLNNRRLNPEVKAVLERHDAKYLLGIQSRQRAEERAARVAREGTQRAKNEAAKAQREMDQQMEDAYRTALIDNPQLNHQKFIINFIAEENKNYGADVTVSPRMRQKLERLGAEKAASDGTKDNSAVETFRKDMEKQLTAQADKVKGRIVEPAEIQKDVARAVGEYERAMEANGGKPLASAEVAALKAKAISVKEKTPAKKFLGITYKKPTFEQGVDSFEEPGPRRSTAPSTDDGGYKQKLGAVRSAEQWLQRPESARDPNRAGVEAQLRKLKKELGLK